MATAPTVLAATTVKPLTRPTAQDLAYRDASFHSGNAMDITIAAIAHDTREDPMLGHSIADRISCGTLPAAKLYNRGIAGPTARAVIESNAPSAVPFTNSGHRS